MNYISVSLAVSIKGDSLPLEGTDLSLICNVRREIPPNVPYQHQWFFKQRHAEFEKNITLENGPGLIMEAITSKNAGTYKCIVTSGGGEGEAIKEVVVQCM
jgi:hypothetical protein